MNKVARIVIEEIRSAILPTIFFFIVFHVIAITKTVMLESYKITPTGVAIATVGALIVAKAILVADKLPFANLSPTAPLAHKVVWKTLIYGTLCLVFRYIEETIPLALKHGSIGVAIEHSADDISWPHFWVLQMWLFISLFSYTLMLEFVRFFGAATIKEALLSPRTASS